MNRLLSLVLLAAVIFIGFVMYRQQDVGYLHAGFGDYKFETSLLVFGVAVLAGLFCLLVLLRVVGLLRKVTDFFGVRRKTRLAEKARTALSKGLIELAEGRFDKAEKLLLQQVKYSDNALLAYLAAARAAQQQGAHERRDEYLRLAHADTPTAEIAIGLTKAELQISHNQCEQALATLTHLYQQSPTHAYVLKLLAKTYQRLCDWEKLSGLLDSIRKHDLLAADKLHSLEIQTWCGLLTERGSHGDVIKLGEQWKQVPHHLKVLPEVVEHYARLLVKCGAGDRAEEVLRQYLNTSWQESSIVHYAGLDLAVEKEQLEVAENWLEQHQHNAHLLLALGKMCVHLKLWGKARSYFEASLAVSPMPESYLQLAMLLEDHIDEPGAAQENYRKGLHLLVGRQAQTETEGLASDTGQDRNKPSLRVV